MSADLLCCERPCECRAYLDPALLRDTRVLENLLKTEEIYTINSSYFDCVQTSITPDMRRIVVEWMLEICENHHSTEEIFTLAVNYLDRFLSVVPLTKHQLQLVATVCLLLASKLREPNPISARLLSDYGADVLRVEDVPGWELLIAAKLKWNMSAVTAGDFLGHLLHRLPLNPQFQDMVRRHAQTFIFLSAREFKFCAFTASIIAGSAIIAALRGLHWTTRGGWDSEKLMNHFSKTLGVEKDYLETCLVQMELMIDATISAANETMPDKEKASTPTDIHDISF